MKQSEMILPSVLSEASSLEAKRKVEIEGTRGERRETKGNQKGFQEMSIEKVKIQMERGTKERGNESRKSTQRTMK